MLYFGGIAAYAVACVVIGWRARSRPPTGTSGNLVMAVVSVGWLAPWLGDVVANTGLPAAQLALAAIAAPLLLLLFAKPLWTAGRFYNATSTAELIGKHYDSRGLHVVATVYGYLVVCLIAVWILTGLGEEVAPLLIGTHGSNAHAYLNQMAPAHAWSLTIAGVVFFLLIGLISGRGLGAVIRIQSVFFIIGVIALGLSMLVSLGGFEGLLQIIKNLLAVPANTTGGRGGADYHTLLAIPGTLEHFDNADGSLLTIGRSMSLVLGLACLVLTPAVSRLFMSETDPRSFPRRMGGADVCLVGGLVAGFVLINGIGGMGSAPEPLSPLRGWLAANKGTLTATTYIISFMALFHIYCGVLANTQPVGRPIKGNLRPLVGVAVAVAVIYSVVTLGNVDLPIGLFLSLAPQLLIPLAGICWWPWMTRSAVISGLVAGGVAVLLTEPQSSGFLTNLGVSYVVAEPLAIGAALWGLMANGIVAGVLSIISTGRRSTETQSVAHGFISRHAAIKDDQRHYLVPVALALVFWVFFALGPGAVIGNDIFGIPRQADGAFEFVWPSLLLWQTLMWVLGAVLIWFIARKSGLVHWSRAALDEIDAEIQRLPLSNGSA